MLIRKTNLKAKSLTLYPSRSFYFNSNPKNFPQLDFPLNIGFNDHFEFYQHYLTFKSKLYLFFRKRQLTSQFKTNYFDLLKAIKH